jgi:hypothetical protein
MIKHRFFGAVPTLAAAALLAGIAAPAMASRLTTPNPAAQSAANLASILSGTWQGSSPGNDLTLTVTDLGSSSGLHQRVFVSVRGQFNGVGVQQNGLLRLAAQGTSAFATYVPHFDAAVSAVSPNATKFSATELQSTCQMALAPAGDGYSGDTLSSADCAQAIRGATGRWNVQVEPGRIRLQNAATGETLTFEPAAGSSPIDPMKPRNR